MKRHIFKDYQQNIVGYLEPSDDSDEGFAIFFLVVIAVAGLILYGVVLWIWEQINNWISLELPYRFIALYYFCIIAMPIKVGCTIYEFLLNSNLTKWPNLNLIISVIGTASYVLFVIMIIICLLKRLSNKFLLSLVLFPALFAMIWFVVAITWDWLFITA